MLRNKLKLNVELVEMSFLSNVGTRKVSCWLEAFTREGRWDANAWSIGDLIKEKNVGRPRWPVY